ncbi:hypothetical protein DQG23_24100 [Paenibacillus contaminans]|uniref:Uncharacterized protein n=1 Tax=Paenibacillus contaminans TaxID=450362 RepID=A0A329MFW8_9BACL|nr:hypothetical protein DQG23_24100 [Paenibacillus contaminans]
MFKSNQILKTDADIDNAMLFESSVTVWQNSEIIDYGGKITKHTKDAVFINDGYYLKAVCEFKIR